MISIRRRTDVANVSSDRDARGGNSKGARSSVAMGVVLVVVVSLVPSCSAAPGDPGDLEIVPIGSVARANQGASTQLTADETPIVVDLYPYEDRDPASEGYPENQYIVSGPPLRFVFPKSALRTLPNWGGGAQNEIQLGYDRKTLEPIGRLLANRPEGERIWQTYHRDYYNRNLSIVVEGNALDLTMDEMERVRRKRYGAEPIAAEMCGFDVIVDPNSWAEPGSPDVTIGGQTLPADSYYGIAQSPASKTRLLNCRFGARICRLTFGYENRQVSYSLPHDLVCEHEKYSDKITSILERHRVELKELR